MVREALALFVLAVLVAFAPGPLAPPAAAESSAASSAAGLLAERAAADALYAEGDYRGALDAYARVAEAQAKLLGAEHPDVLWTRFSMSSALRDLGRADEALAILDELRPLYLRVLGPESAETWRLIMNRAAALADVGRFDEAIAEAIPALDWFVANLGPDHTTTLFGYANLASLYQERGFLDEALQLYRDVLPRFGTVTDWRRTVHRAGMLWDAARLAAKLGEGRLALGWYREAVPLALRTLGETHPDLALPMLEAARVALDLGETELAGQFLATGHPAVLAAYGDESFLSARYDVEIGRYLAAARGLDGASLDEVFDLMFSGLGKLDRLLPAGSPDKDVALVPLLSVAVQIGDWGGALELARELDRIGRLPRGSGYAALAGAAGAGLLPEAEATEWAFRLAQQAAAGQAARATRFLAAQLALGTSGEAGALLKALADGMLANERAQAAYIGELNAGLPDAALAAKLAAELAAWPAERSRLLGALRAAAPRYGDLLVSQPLTIAAAQERLGPRDVLLLADAARQGEGESHAFLVTADAARWLQIDLPPDGGASLVSRIRDAIGGRLGTRAGAALGERRAAGGSGFDFAAAHEIYRALLLPFEDLLAGRDHLYVELRGPLSALPPELWLRRPAEDPASADWLVRHMSVSVLPAVRALGLGRGEVRAPLPFIGFADAVFTPEAHPGRVAGLAVDPARRGGALPPLPETAGEVRAVAQALGAPQGLRAGEAASESLAKKGRLDRYRVLYFATHGLVAGDLVAQGEVQEPALALSAGDGEDGILTASEIAALRLNADWVVLSACNTALGERPGAEALSGLAQAFLFAGARALMVSHWPVESRSAVALMTDLFARRAADPDLSAAEAQRQAILAMIDHPARPEWRHPAYWAPFVLIGDPGSGAPG